MAGLYIHVPFCHSKCAYCDFYSLGRKDSTKEQLFVGALKNEWRVRRDEISETIRTVYIGGGTPSHLQPAFLMDILAIAAELPHISEFTVEVNPEDVTPGLCRLLTDAGVNRVSMGVQSLSDIELAEIGRRHSAQKALEAVALLRSHGINNISCDLIFGLPRQSVKSWTDSLKKMLILRPEHLSSYLLSYEPGTRLTARLNRGLITETAEETIEEMYSILCEETKAAGYEHYEISNYALPGHRSRHNSAYWTCTPYLGLGPGAHSFDGQNRSFNEPNLKKYIESGGIINEKESLTPDERRNEKVMLALRTAEGLCLSDFHDTGRLIADARKFIRQGILLLDNGGNHLKMAERHWLVTDSVLTDLFI